MLGLVIIKIFIVIALDDIKTKTNVILIFITTVHQRETNIVKKEVNNYKLACYRLVSFVLVRDDY